jgi:hypothetical protein
MKPWSYSIKLAKILDFLSASSLAGNVSVVAGALSHVAVAASALSLAASTANA